jgi:predicted TIM-barrel fold metal-dependent hydrolase
MRVIDADTHVHETEATWEYIVGAERPLRPTAAVADSDPNRPPTHYWVIDGRRQLRNLGDDAAGESTVETRELIDPAARLRDMDGLGVDVHVIYPTLFLVEFTERPEVELALRRGYNRWLADRCADSNGRLRWVCLPPLRSMDEAIEELRFAKEHGACGVLKKGDAEAGKWPNDPYFFPLYAEAERLDLPICFHLGSGVPNFSPAREFSSGRMLRIGLPVVHAFHSLILHGVPARFPRLRFGFIEVGATWVPFVLYDLQRRLAKQLPGRGVLGGPRFELPPDVVRANRLYVTCQVDEDLPYILEAVGEDNLLLGSDYGHPDPSREREFPRLLQHRADQGHIPQTAVHKILHENARAFYGL